MRAPSSPGMRSSFTGSSPRSTSSFGRPWDRRATPMADRKRPRRRCRIAGPG